jgi:type IV secretory pathway VirB10-like protein
MRVAVVLALAGCLLSASATATTLYTWIDAQGRTQYSDRPPKDFKGEVRRIETEAPPPPPESATEPRPGGPPVVPAAAPAAKAEVAPRGIAEQRRATREKLEKELTAARGKVEEARRALADGQDATVDDRQLLHRPMAPAPGQPGVHVPTALRSNCRVTETPSGGKTTACPVSVPTEAYYARVHELEEALAHAEAELEAAQLAYRRGVD